MCGITGILLFDKKNQDVKTNVHQSNEMLISRGPNSGAVWEDEHAAFGHRRLSIIDTSDAAGQPMTDHTGNFVLTFNGEIFNFTSLKNKHLDQKFNINWKTNSDTEVLLYLLIHYGTKCLEWLHGFFAFSFYDINQKRLILARDPLGKKPLIIYNSNSYIAFSSEMKALMKYGWEKKINFTVLNQYLQLNYIPQPQSMLEGITKLLPGHYVEYSIQNKNATPIAYFKLQCQPDRYSQWNYQEAQHQLVGKMEASILERLISDVPLGAFLSGGIDSSVIVALASRHTHKLNTFSIGYKDNPFFDETKYAKLVADKFNTNHHVFKLSNNDFLEHINGVLDYIDEPFADSSAIPLYILSHLTAKEVTVALSGDGADEVFSGYNKHAAEWKMRQKSLKKSLVTAGVPLWSILPHSRSNKITNLFRQLDRFAKGSKLSIKERYWEWASFLNFEEAQNLLSDTVLNKINKTEFEQQKNHLLRNINSADFNEILLTDVNLVLLSDMLVKVDLMSMANSIEVRSPFLDKRVVSFAFGLPSTFKIDGSMKKKIVQDAFRNVLPAELYNRPKHGFEIPLLNWFRNELWGLINDDLLQDSFIEKQGIFNPKAIQNLKLKLKSNNPEDSHATIWALIVFQYWWKKYFN
jgi:asparagine synthase (glutamine-hydrolysing)